MGAIAPLIASMALIFLAMSSAYAAKFSFDPSSGTPLMAANYALPTAVVAIASFVGGLLIFLERRRARGMWFSNNERLK